MERSEAASMIRSLCPPRKKLAQRGGTLQNTSVSKEQLIAELEKLSPEERQEIFEAFWPRDFDLSEPTEDEKALLDRELEDYRKNPTDVVPWEEVKARFILRG
jgi:putative addiction module component (TIGR02574 family)